MRKLTKGTKIEDFISSLSEQTQEALFELEGRPDSYTSHIDELGEVKVYLDECSEGADRGGYVLFVKLLEVIGPNSEAIVLEADTDGSCWMFEGRSTRL